LHLVVTPAQKAMGNWRKHAGFKLFELIECESQVYRRGVEFCRRNSTKIRISRLRLKIGLAGLNSCSC